MNETLTTLCDAYLNDGTGSVAVYYSFDSGSVSSIGSAGNFTGVFLNQSPSHFVGKIPAISSVTGSSNLNAENSLKESIFNNSFNISGKSLYYNNISGESFLNPDDLDSNLIYLFSFKKRTAENGILFGSLRRETFDNEIVNFSYGRGFNVGLTDRNNLFFQGSDSVVGDYVLVADEIELATENICSLKVSPYGVTFARYNLIDDGFQQQYLRTNCKIQNIGYEERSFLGESPLFLNSGHSFNGFIDNLMIISGDHAPSDLKAVSSGFVCTGIKVSGASYFDEILTGQSIELFYAIGITGFQPVITGYSNVAIPTELIEFVLVENQSPLSRNDGERFLTGYTLPNNSGFYLEETSFLIKDDFYKPTGDMAHATLNLRDSGNFVAQYSLQSTKLINTSGLSPMYELQPITGTLVQEPTGYLKTELTTTIEKTGNIIQTLEFLSEYKNRFKKDYLFYMESRL